VFVEDRQAGEEVKNSAYGKVGKPVLKSQTRGNLKGHIVKTKKEPHKDSIHIKERKMHK